MTKAELAAGIWTAFAAFHAAGGDELASRGLPEIIPVGDGKSLIIPDEAARLMHAFTRLVHENDPERQVAFGSKDIGDLVRNAFGAALTKIDLDTPTAAATALLLGHVGDCLDEAFAHPRGSHTFVIGCWLIRDDIADDLVLGPVRFERRTTWLGRAHAEGDVSATTHRRLLRLLRGRRLRPLKVQGTVG